MHARATCIQIVGGGGVAGGGGGGGVSINGFGYLLHHLVCCFPSFSLNSITVGLLR